MGNDDINSTFENLSTITQIRNDSGPKIFMLAESFKNSLIQPIYNKILQNTYFNDFSNPIEITKIGGNSYRGMITFKSVFKNAVDLSTNWGTFRSVNESFFFSPNSKSNQCFDSLIQKYILRKINQELFSSFIHSTDMNGNRYVNLQYDYLISALDICTAKLPFFVHFVIDLADEVLNHFILYILKKDIMENLAIRGLVFFAITLRITYSDKTTTSTLNTIFNTYFLEILEFLFFFLNSMHETLRAQVRKNISQNLENFITKNEVNLLEIIKEQVLSNNLLFFFFKLRNHKWKSIPDNFKRKKKSQIYSEISKIKNSFG